MKYSQVSLVLILIIAFGLPFSSASLADTKETPAPADSRELVQDTELKILGKGIQDRRTGETLAIACIDIDCTTLSFILLAEDGKLYFMGKPHKLPIAPTPELQAEANLNSITTWLIDVGPQKKPELSQAKREGRDVFVIFLAAGATTALILTGGVTFPAFLPFLSSVGLYIVSQTASDPFRALSSGTRLITHEHGISGSAVSMNDQRGWNWSVNPTIVRHRHFQEQVRMLDFDRLHARYYTNPRCSWHYIKKLSKEYVKLRDAGVIYPQRD